MCVMHKYRPVRSYRLTYFPHSIRGQPYTLSSCSGIFALAAIIHIHVCIIYCIGLCCIVIAFPVLQTGIQIPRDPGFSVRCN